MKHSSLTICAFAALLLTNQAIAHTGVRDTATEGAGSYNAFTLTHGCSNSTEGGPPALAYPVIGQGAVFPHGNNVVWRNKAGAIIQTGGNGNGTISTPTLNLSVAGIAGGSPFATYQEIVNDLGVVQGLLWKDGVMAPNMYALPQFRVTAPTITDNCVENLKIRIGVINYCDIGKNANNDSKGPYEAPRDLIGKKIKKVTSSETGFVQRNTSQVGEFYEDTQKGNGDNNRADWWFTQLEGGSVYYNDHDLLQETYWTTMTVKNAAADVALCAGTKTDVSVEPTGAAFDTILSPANTQPFTKKDAKGNL
ncbi:hypothetical protein MCAMS1_00495 [biofilm metagenome]